MDWKDSLWPEWTVESEIGAGAYGKVYKIVRQDIGGTYYAALKIISVPYDRDEADLLRNANMSDGQIVDYYRRFAEELSKEFSVMERLKGNTNIVSYEDHKIVPHKGHFGWDVLIRMELLTPLSTYIHQREYYEKDVLQLGIDICNALDLCESEGIIHRDIKPGNIFVSAHGNYKLGDFSTALHMENRSLGLSPRGTYAYMAPEVYNRQRYDYTIDIYSLGLILYRLLNNGRAPFLPPPPKTITHKMIEEANQRRLRGEPFPKPASASMAASNVILKACAFDPGRRYQSAKELRSSLEYCKMAQVPLDVTKHVNNYVKKAVQAFSDKEDRLHNENRLDKEDRLPEAFTGREPSRKTSSSKNMGDFFQEAGDL